MAKRTEGAYEKAYKDLKYHITKGTIPWLGALIKIAERRGSIDEIITEIKAIRDPLVDEFNLIERNLKAGVETKAWERVNDGC